MDGFTIGGKLSLTHLEDDFYKREREREGEPIKYLHLRMCSLLTQRINMIQVTQILKCVIR